MEALATVAVIIVVWSALSGPLDRRGVTSAIFFTLAGILAGEWVLGLIDVSLENETAKHVTELALVLLLFSDASRLDPGSLSKDRSWPRRLLLIGLPLTLILGTLVGWLVFPGMALASVFLLSTMLASTDAALGQKVVTDPSVPARLRQALDVESGLNDGLAVPFFLVALDVANAELTTGLTWAVLGNAVEQIGWGLVAGVAVGLLGGLLFRTAERRGWLEGEWRRILPLAAALAAYGFAAGLGGSVFIAAFVGGMVFRRGSRAPGATTLFAEETGGLLAAVTWIGFGAMAITWALPNVTWQVVLYAALSLTLVRMLPVAIAMLGHSARWPTVTFMGWFGPRGLASLVFGILVIEEGVPDQQMLITTVIVTVGLSVILHGLTSVPLIARYHRWYEQHTAAHPAAPEAAPTTMSRMRHESAVGDVVRAQADGGSE